MKSLNTLAALAITGIAASYIINEIREDERKEREHNARMALMSLQLFLMTQDTENEEYWENAVGKGSPEERFEKDPMSDAELEEAYDEYVNGPKEPDVDHIVEEDDEEGED